MSLYNIQALRICMQANHLMDSPSCNGYLGDDLQTAALVHARLEELLRDCPRTYSEGYMYDKTMGPLRYPRCGASETTLRVWQDQAGQMVHQIFRHLNLKCYREGRCDRDTMLRWNSGYKAMAC